MIDQRFSDTLNGHQLRKKLVGHPFFGKIASADLARGQVATFLGQWWHPLHYFPTYLSRLISVTPRVDVKTAISKILYQELGEGDSSRAHEVVFTNTMTRVGFSKPEVNDAAPLPASAKLVAAYAAASSELLPGLGFLYGTEVADLAMVSGIGTAVRRATGAKELEWVDIHVEQEPEHVARAKQSVAVDFTEVEEKAILAGAESLWKHWIDFFDQLDETVFAKKTMVAAS